MNLENSIYVFLQMMIASFHLEIDFVTKALPKLYILDNMS
jgi:hypothetical protein